MANEKDVSVKISKHIKKLVVDGSQQMKQTEKQFVENAIVSHCSKLEAEQPLIKKMKDVGLI